MEVLGILKFDVFVLDKNVSLLIHVLKTVWIVVLFEFSTFIRDFCYLFFLLFKLYYKQ